MSHRIYKFKLPANTLAHNSVEGDEPAHKHILRAVTLAKIPSRNIRDLSTVDEINVAVTFESEIEEATFKLACGVPPTTILP